MPSFFTLRHGKLDLSVAAPMCWLALRSGVVPCIEQIRQVLGSGGGLQNHGLAGHGRHNEQMSNEQLIQADYLFGRRVKR